VTDAPLHPDLAPLAFLLGTWRGEGSGRYPTIAGFAYVEEVVFGHVGKPILAYSQRTRDAASGEARHSEAGYWRVVGPGRLELVMAHPTGVAEIGEGTFEGGHIAVTSTAVTLTATAKPVSAVRRTIDVTGETLVYRLDMAAVGQPLQPHLEARLRRG
jgi:THAP4-like, heme-binding beta-barrel domain